MTANGPCSVPGTVLGAKNPERKKILCQIMWGGMDVPMNTHSGELVVWVGPREPLVRVRGLGCQKKILSCAVEEDGERCF